MAESARDTIPAARPATDERDEVREGVPLLSVVLSGALRLGPASTGLRPEAETPKAA